MSCCPVTTLNKGQVRNPGDTRARSPCSRFTRRRINSGNGKRNFRPTVDTGRTALDGTGPGQRKSSPLVRSGAARRYAHDRTKFTGKLVDGPSVVRPPFARSGVQARQRLCMADGGLLSRVNNQNSLAGNGRDGADILVGSPTLRALLRLHHRVPSRKTSATRRADDCTGPRVSVRHTLGSTNIGAIQATMRRPSCDINGLVEIALVVEH